MEIRRLVEGDEEAACQLIEQVKFAIDEVADVSLDPADVAALVSDERSYLIAAYVDERPVGLVYGYRFPRLDGPRPMMFLYEAGVLEEFRRRGIGRALVEELKRFAEESDCRKMFVPTQASNEAAMALYRSAGGAEGDADPSISFWWNW